MVARVLRPGDMFIGQQGVAYPLRVTTETAGAERICLTVLPIPPGVRAKVHYHDRIETIAYLLEGECILYHGKQLERRVVVRAGECVYLPAGMPHAPCNESDAACTWVVTHAAGDDDRASCCCPNSTHYSLLVKSRARPKGECPIRNCHPRRVTSLCQRGLCVLAAGLPNPRSLPASGRGRGLGYPVPAVVARRPARA